jgi:hypothetical protein
VIILYKQNNQLKQLHKKQKRNNKDKNKQLVVIIAEPQDPKYLPNNPARQEPIKDKNTINKYIIYIN